MKRIAGVLGLLVLGIGVLFASDILAPIVNFGDAGLITIKTARGQSTDKEHVYSGDILSGIRGYGYGLTAWGTSAGVAIKMKANQDWTASAQGTKITFETTPDDSTTAAEVMSIDDNGNVAIAGNVTHSLKIINSVQAVQSVKVASTTLTPTGEFQLIGSTGAITLVGAPTIATTTAVNGQTLILLSTASTITLNDMDTQATSLLQLSAATITVTTSTPVSFIFYKGNWFERK